MKNRARFFVLLSLLLLTLQALTILGSWIVSAVWPTMGIHSLLSGNGLRWLLVGMLEKLSDSTLVWIILSCMVLGTFIWSGLPKKIISSEKKDYRERFAMIVFYFILIVSVSVCVVMALFPHSSFLGVTGHLVPGPFVGATFIVLGFGLFVGSLVFLFLSGRIDSYESVEKTSLYGIQNAAQLIVIYLLLKELVEMLDFVL